MSLIPPKIIDAVWRMIPGPLRRRLRSQGGRRLIRFAPAAVRALCATQLAYFILQLANVTAVIAGATGLFAGDTVRYRVARVAWEGKGRPHPREGTLPLAPRGFDDVLRELHRIERVVPLLALADLAPANRGGPLGDAVAVRDHADQQLGGLVLRLVEADSAGDLGAHRPEPERRVADPLTGERAYREREHPHAQPPNRILGLLAAWLPGAGDEIRLAGQDRPA